MKSADDHPSLTVKVPEGYSEVVYTADSRCEPFEKDGKISSIEGDFDGDGIKDNAKILVKNDEKVEFLYVWLSSKNNTPMVLDTIKDKESLNNMALSLVPRGTEMQDACARGYTELCGSNNFKEAKLKNDSLSYTKCESAMSVFYWDQKEQNFQRFWYND